MGSKSPIPQMSLLANSFYYFLERVFIVNAAGDYRLLVIHRNRVLWNKNYKSIKGAKIAFSKHFKHKAYKPSVKSEWTMLYSPDEDWIDSYPNFTLQTAFIKQEK